MERLDKRDLNLDLIRCVAVCCVFAVHFFMNADFYSTPVLGLRMSMMVFMRTGFMVCVPLFLLLTGYLMKQKVLSKQYYRGMGKTVCIYVLASILCMLFTHFHGIRTFTLGTAILAILDFSGADYAWYIRMYLGLFLLIPFLNLAYKGLQSKRQKQWLLVSMFVLTSLPALVNIRYKVLPDWWTQLYPLTYYFIGAYIREYGIRLKPCSHCRRLAGQYRLFSLVCTGGRVSICRL